MLRAMTLVRAAKWILVLAFLLIGIAIYVSSAADTKPRCTYDQINGWTGPNCNR
jgi:hypothetical protein